MKFYKKNLEVLLLSLLRTQLQLHFQRSLWITLRETFYFNDVLQNWHRDC